ncbi:tetratricopeptide repeat protein [Cognatishimia sp. D5M38]|uniref:Tetratricopeptide repeat protein n=1 Tax=Cognatishimia coralii TaxID=3083254 RepID=A0ABU8QKN6_9RHOB
MAFISLFTLFFFLAYDAEFFEPWDKADLLLSSTAWNAPGPLTVGSENLIFQCAELAAIPAAHFLTQDPGVPNSWAVAEQRDLSMEKMSEMAAICQLAADTFPNNAEVAAMSAYADRRILQDYRFREGEVDIPMLSFATLDKFEAALNAGSLLASVEVGLAHISGFFANEFIPENRDLGHRLIKRAADLGYPYAQYQLGLIYEKGRTGKYQFVEAGSYYRAAAQQGYAPAQFRLGKLHQVGLGVEESSEVALHYITLAADMGLPIALEWLDQN